MSDQNKNEQHTDTSDLAEVGRRKLLKLGVYSAPLIIGSLTLSRSAAAASCMPTCMPSLPCMPDGGP